jgi:phosphohistidine phosphatase SixA
VAETVGYPTQRILAAEVFSPKAAPKHTAEFLCQFPGASRILAVGHLPNLAELASFALTPGPSMHITFENAGLTCLEISAPAARNGSLAYHLPPRLIQMMVGR